MTFKPWDCAQPDEWLPRSLRLCWGSSSSGSGSGFGDAGFSATTGAGDWGSAGTYDASSFNATGDVGAWAGTAYDASTSGTGAGAAGDWASFGPTNYSGMNAPNPIFTDIAGPNPGVTTGAGDWGSAGTFSAAGTGGGPAGTMVGAALGAGSGLYGDGPGGLFGDYSSGGDAGGGRGGTIGSPFGSFGTIGTLGASNTGRGSERSSSGPIFSDTTGSVGGRGAGPAAAGRITSDAPTRSEAEVESVVGPEAEAGPEAAPEAAPDEAAPEAAPGGRITSDAPTRSEAEIASVDPEAAAAPEAEQAQPSQQEAGPDLSAFGPQAFQESLSGMDLAGDRSTPQGDINPSSLFSMGWEPSNAYEGRGADYASGRAAQDYYTGISNLMTDLMSRGPDPQVALDRAIEQAQGGPPVWALNPRSFELVAPTPQWAQNPRSFEVFDPKADALAQSRTDAKSLWDISTYLSAQNQTPLNVSVFNAITGALSGLRGSGFDQQALGEQGKAGQQTDLATQLGTQDITSAPNVDTTPLGDVFAGAAPPPADLASQLGIDNIDTTPWGSVFEAPAQEPDYASVFEGAAPMVEEAQPSIEAFIPGGRETDFANAAPGRMEAFIPGGRETNFDYGPSAADPNAPTNDPWSWAMPTYPADPWSWAMPSYDRTTESGPPGAPPTTDNAATPGGDPALSGAPANAAPAPAAPWGWALAAPGALDARGTPDAPGQPGMAQEGGGQPQSQGITLGQLQDAVYGSSGPYITSGGNIYGGHTLADIQAAVYGSSPPGMPTGNPNADLSNETSQPSANINPGRAEAFIPGGRTTDFEYAGAPQAQPAPPSLVDMAQPGAGRSGASIPGGRGTDWAYTPTSTDRGIDPGIGPGVEVDDDHDAPEPQDSSMPAGRDPNAPTPPGNIPGQLRGQNGSYQNPHADTPQTSRTYRDSGRTDYPQGQPGITFRTARQAGIQPLFRTEDINVEDTDARLVDNINRALQAMEQRTGIPANSLVATSGWRAAHRGEAAEHFMDPRTSQESVYSRGNPRSGNPFAAAPPGHSNHGPGRAIDFSPRGDSGRALAWLRANAREFGLETLGRNFDVPHIQLRGGGAGQRPSAQEQQAQRALDAQNRQAAIDAGLIGGGRNQQVAGVPLPRGRPSDAPQTEVAQPDVVPTQPPAAALPPPEAPLAPTFDGSNWSWALEGTNAPPAGAPAVTALPPPEAPLNAPRPPADIPIDIPVQTVPPAVAPRTAQAAMGFAKFLADNLGKTGKLPSNREEGQQALTALAHELARAGYPASVAQKTILETATQGSIKAGYGPNSAYNALGHVTQAINEMAATAMQGYRTGKMPEAQGPPAPADLVAPGKRSEAPGVLQFARELTRPPDPNAPPPDPNAPPPPPARGGRTMIANAAPGLMDMLGNALSQFNPISTAEARGGRSQAGNLQAPRADPGTIQGRLSEARSDIVNELQTNQGLRNTLDLIVTGEVGSQGKAAVLGFLETAFNKVAAEASREGRTPTGRDLLNYLNNRSYFPDTWGKIESGKVRGGALTDDLLGAIGAGSNTTQMSTGNSSASSQGSRFGGNPTNATIGKEHYGVENYAHHAAWYNAMGAPAPGRGIGSDYAAGPYDAPAMGAMPTQDAPLRGLAKGGHVAEDETVVVGERGPEYFVPDWSRPAFHVPQPGQPGNVDRWPKVPAPEYPGQYGGIEREIRRQSRAAQDFRPSLVDMINRGQLRFNPNAWDRWLNDPKDVALGWSRIEDRR